MIKIKIYGAIVIVTIVFYALFEWIAPRSVSWEASLKYQDKKPYGTYVFYESLQNLFPESNVNHNRKNYYELWENDTTYNHNLFIIRPDFYTDEYSTDALLDYIYEGNNVFISSFSFDSYFNDTLGISMNSKYVGKEGELIPLHLGDYPNDKVFIKYAHITTFINLKELKYNYKVLGKSTGINFLRIDIGEGHLYLHSNPIAFTNFNILKKQTTTYVEHVVSYLPEQDILWDTSLDIVQTEDRRALRYILSEKHLKIAYYLALVLFIMYILFKAKREQRAIPIVAPPANNSLELVDSVSQLYIHKKSHKNMADKMIRHFFDYLQNRYYIRSQILNDTFIDKLSKKSAKDEGDVKLLIQLMITIRNSEHISDVTLLELNSRIEQFKQDKNTKS